MVFTDRVGTPRSMTVFSCSVEVGHACTHAPHETHSESMKRLARARRTTRESKPRPEIVSANVPCTSPHARTQREQAMHLLSSKEKYGLLSSVAPSRWFAPSMP